ncbi:MAG TPA: OsmC family protein [Dokdonella sp.]|uniref:OsmC family protein n=1 Tax=Dokdonella sp. TaxID=2291710 RepID=UPI002D8026D4|nr:OsmC family protein [Dokdonella sp.]HET9031438.1 OsmC family protein [Dokdonella sp.]
MQAYPHIYRVAGSAELEGAVTLTSAGLDAIESWPPAEFGGPGDAWSPETLLVGAIADCFVLSFRAIARASGLTWTRVQCSVDAKLDRVDGVTRFTDYILNADLHVPADTDIEAAQKALHKAKRSCLISNSLLAEGELIAVVHNEG